MLKALIGPGVLEHLPIAVAIASAGYLMIKGVLEAWNAWLRATKKIAGAEVETHEKSHHAGDATFREELRAALRQIGEDIRAVHGRIDEHLNQELEEARRKRAGE